MSFDKELERLDLYQMGAAIEGVDAKASSLPEIAAMVQASLMRYPGLALAARLTKEKAELTPERVQEELEAEVPMATDDQLEHPEVYNDGLDAGLGGMVMALTEYAHLERLKRQLNGEQDADGALMDALQSVTSHEAKKAFEDVLEVLKSSPTGAGELLTELQVLPHLAPMPDAAVGQSVEAGYPPQLAQMLGIGALVGIMTLKRVADARQGQSSEPPAEPSA